MTTILAIQGAPDAPDFSATPMIFGNDFKANGAGQITGMWYYHSSSNEPASVTAQMHLQSNQSLLRSKQTTTSGMTDNAWNFIAFDSAYTYSTPDTLVTLSAYWPSGGFVYKTGASEHSASGLTAVVGGIGRFKNSSANELDYPNQTSANLACPVGMEFVAGGSTVTGTASASLGGLNATGVGVRTVLGVATAALGGLTALASAAGAGASDVLGGGWYDLLAIEQEMLQMLEDERNRVPVACPNDGEPLRTGSNGELFCPFDGWRHR